MGTHPTAGPGAMHKGKGQRESKKSDRQGGAKQEGAGVRTSILRMVREAEAHHDIVMFSWRPSEVIKGP